MVTIRIGRFYALFRGASVLVIGEEAAEIHIFLSLFVFPEADAGEKLLRGAEGSSK